MGQIISGSQRVATSMSSLEEAAKTSALRLDKLDRTIEALSGQLTNAAQRPAAARTAGKVLGQSQLPLPPRPPRPPRPRRPVYLTLPTSPVEDVMGGGPAPAAPAHPPPLS